MIVLFIKRGPGTGRHFLLGKNLVILGRNADCTNPLDGRQISREHAHIQHQDGQFFLQDLGSSNGTFLNSERLAPNTLKLLTERDTFQIGPYLFELREAPPSSGSIGETLDSTGGTLHVTETISVTNLDKLLLAPDPAMKLQMVLETVRQLACALELDPLLDKLLQHLMKLCPQTDRFMVILCEDEKLVVRAQRTRMGIDLSGLSFSRTIARRCLDEAIAIICDDLQTDNRFKSGSAATLDIHSIICVPLIDLAGKRLGVIEADRMQTGFGFGLDDLYLLSALGMQVAIVLENVAFRVRAALEADDRHKALVPR